MAVEIERKFLLKDDSWKQHVDESVVITQGYLSRDPERTVRVRRRGDRAMITVKGRPAATDGDAAPAVPEFEYEIPAADADALLPLCLPGAVEKTRHLVRHDGHTWEIDVFHGDNDGLVMAEIELSSATESFTPPPWLGAEVTRDRRYANAALAEKPFRQWDRPAQPKPPGL
jgi:CYTH domain-containing protein